MRNGLVAIKSTRWSFTSLLTDGLLSALVFVVVSGLPRLRESVFWWLGSIGKLGRSPAAHHLLNHLIVISVTHFRRPYKAIEDFGGLHAIIC
jgi:hypothetical protein